jgi:ribosomal protein S18 acetylase RimI-like enzyme
LAGTQGRLVSPWGHGTRERVMAVLTSLQPEQDEADVHVWLRAYLREHLRWWSGSTGPLWSDEAIDAHLASHDLVSRDWQEILKASTSARCFVQVLRGVEGGAPVGLVWAELGRDRVLKIRLGVLSWIYVAPEARGQGLAGRLLDAADGWMRDQQVAAREVFVTAANEAAVRLYTAHGYSVVDHRMLAASPVRGENQG